MTTDLIKDNKIALFLDTCARIEGSCAELYHYYSEIFQECKETSDLWKKTALEEENHKRQFELALRLHENAEFALVTDLDDTYRIYHRLQNLLEHVRVNPPDMITALTKAIEMEERLAGLHMESSVRFGNKSIQEMFQAMSDFDHEHVNSLKRLQTILMLPRTVMAG